MTLITDEYRRLNTQLHFDRASYGAKGKSYGTIVYEELIKPYGIQRFLDYGCGKGSLVDHLNTKYGTKGERYDPCVSEFAKMPEGTYYAVTCTDCLEHVEPACIDAVLEHIKSLTEEFLFVSIGLTLSPKYLSNGKNAHVLVREIPWWKNKFTGLGFRIIKEITEGLPQSDLWTALLLKERQG